LVSGEPRDDRVETGIVVHGAVEFVDVVRAGSSPVSDECAALPRVGRIVA
jgi:hypothetical protein